MREVDGQKYEEGQAIHDLGSFECVGVVEGTNQRIYEGLLNDPPKMVHRSTEG